MIRAGSELSLRYIPVTQVHLRSNRNPEQLGDYFAAFHRTLLAGHDLPPVWLLHDRQRGMYELQDGRKRFAAAILAGRETILAVVEEREA